jgi:hypothetical protein
MRPTATEECPKRIAAQSPKLFGAISTLQIFQLLRQW